MRIPESIAESQETVAPSNMYLRNVSSPEMFGSGLAKGLGRMGELELQLQQEKMRDDEETSVLAAYNKASEARAALLYDPERGLYAKQGVDARDLHSAFDTEARNIAEQASAGLTPQGKKRFQGMWDRSSISDKEGLMRYEIGERNKHRMSTGNATVDLAISNAVADYSNPETIARSKSEIAGAILSTFKGAGEEQLQEALLTGYSSLHKGVVMQLAVISPAKAEQYYNENKDEMVAADHVQVTNYLKGQIFKSTVGKQVERITGSGGPVSKLYEELLSDDLGGKDLAQVMEHLEFAESSHRPGVETNNYVNGKVSPEKTAVGLTQVLVSTARGISRDIGDGIMDGKSTAEVKELLKDPTLNRRYGTFYLKQQLAKFGGDLEAALVAYNAGPANASKWLKAGRDYAALPDPGQTRPYVRKIMGRLHKGMQGTPYVRTAQNMSLAGVQTTATDAEIETFRGQGVATSSGDIAPSIENGAAQMYASMPELVRQGLEFVGTGGDLTVNTEDQFTKDWIMFNAPTFGLDTVDEGPQVRLRDGSGSADVSPIVEADEYDLNQWIAEAEQIQDPAVRDATVKSLMNRHAALQKAAKQDDNSLKQKAWAMALEGQEIPIELKKRLTPSYLSSIEEYQKKVASGTKITTEWETWAAIRQMSDEELRGIGDVMQYRSKLADPEFKQLVDMVRDVRGDAAPDKKGLAAVLRSRSDIVKDTATQHFRNDKAAVGKLNRALDEQIDAYHTMYGKVPDNKEMQGMVDRLMLKGQVEGGWRDIRNIFDINPGEKIAFSIVQTEKEIPEFNRSTARAREKALFGRPLTEFEMTMAYSAAVLQSRGATVRTPEALRKIFITKWGTPPTAVDNNFGKAAAALFGLSPLPERKP